MNGNANKTMVSYLQSVNYICNTGYRMNGSATAMCSADGTLQMPTCNSEYKIMLTIISNNGNLKAIFLALYEDIQEEDCRMSPAGTKRTSRSSYVVAHLTCAMHYFTT